MVDVADGFVCSLVGGKLQNVSFMKIVLRKYQASQTLSSKQPHLWLASLRFPTAGLGKHCEAVAQPIILFRRGQSMISSVTDVILGPTVPSFSLQQLKIDIKSLVKYSQVCFGGGLAFLTSFLLRCCFEALPEPDLRSLNL